MDITGSATVERPGPLDLVQTREPVRFSDVENAAGEHGLIPLGLKRGSGADARVDLNPNRDAEWKLAPDDRVVVMATFEKSSATSSAS